MLEPALRDPTTLQNHLETSNSFYQNLLGYKPEQTQLEQIPENEWNKFVIQRGLNLGSSGIYLPRNQTAFIQEGNLLSLFHEYFGHGLYCEQSLQGRKLVDLERRLLKEEKEFFNENKFIKEDLDNFRKENETFKYLINFKENNLGIYEGFAIFTEYFLSKNFSLENLFEEKYGKLNENSGKYVNGIISFNNGLGDLATFYAFELNKVQDQKRLLRLAQDIFGKKLERTRLILHFGSGKPFSDIDLFVVSSDIPSTYDPWLDVRAYKHQDMTEGIKVLNPMITDPIIVGRLVFGDEDYLGELKRKILVQPITEEAIRFNLKEYETEKRRSKDSSLGEYLQNKNLHSAKIFLTNALALKNGDKILTSKRLVNYAKKRFSHSEKFIELKGGIE